MILLLLQYYFNTFINIIALIDIKPKIKNSISESKTLNILFVFINWPDPIQFSSFAYYMIVRVRPRLPGFAGANRGLGAGSRFGRTVRPLSFRVVRV